MIIPELPSETRLERIEFARLKGRRPRAAGKNARLDEHGVDVTLDAVRVTMGGLSGWGWSRVSRDQALSLQGASAEEIFDQTVGIRPEYRALQFPLLDCLGRASGRPVFALLNPDLPTGEPLRAPCYDTSLYIDDLHLPDDGAAVALMQSEAREGLAQGHTAFKIKVGRGGRHMPLEAGMRRDAAVVRGIREAAGHAAVLMLDANNGLNLNLAKRLLAETAEARIFWLEEPFHEDDVLYRDLKHWMAREGLRVLVADGEGAAHPELVRWAERGLVDVVQYDVRGYGFVEWLELGGRLDKANVRTAPHQYGGMYGNYVAPHLAAAIRGFTYAEWDDARMDGVDASAYAIEDGQVVVPSRPGFGLELDEAFFGEQARREGWVV